MIRPERGARAPNRPLAERNGAGRGRVGWRFSPSHPSDSIPLYSFPQKGKSVYVPSMAPAALPSPFFFMSGKTKWPAKASERGRSQTVRGDPDAQSGWKFVKVANTARRRVKDRQRNELKLKLKSWNVNISLLAKTMAGILRLNELSRSYYHMFTQASCFKYVSTGQSSRQPPSQLETNSVDRFITEKVPRKIMKFPEPFTTISKVWEFSQNCFLWHFY